jgi:hypothetical protein
MDGLTFTRSLRAAEVRDLIELRSICRKGRQAYARNGRWVNHRLQNTCYFWAARTALLAFHCGHLVPSLSLKGTVLFSPCHAVDLRSNLTGAPVGNEGKYLSTWSIVAGLTQNEQSASDR